MSKFKIGDKIKVINNFGEMNLSGYTGTIMKDNINNINDIVVEFDKEFAGGHTCNHICKDGYGRYGNSSEVELVEEEKNGFNIGDLVECVCDNNKVCIKNGKKYTILAIIDRYHMKVRTGNLSIEDEHAYHKARFKLVIEVPKDELKNDKMDISEISKLDKGVLKTAKANVLKARKEENTKRAEAVLTELLNIKDAIEDKISEDQEVLNDVIKDISVFDIKAK